MGSPDDHGTDILVLLALAWLGNFFWN